MFDSVKITSLVLRKQHLVPLTFGSKPSDLPRIVGDVCGLQWDSAERENPDWVLRNRFTEFGTEWLENSVKDRSVIEFRLMRGSPYIVPSKDLPYYFAATREVVKKASYGYFKLPYPAGISAKEKKVLDALQHHAPATKSELSRRTKLAKNELWKALFNLDNLGHIVRVGWKGAENLWHPTVDWLPGLDMNRVTREEGEEFLATKFLEAAGPSTKQCLSQWTGWSLSTATRSVDRLLNRGILVQLTPDNPESLIALHGDINELNREMKKDSTVRFLSPFDPYLWMRKSVLGFDSSSTTQVGIYTVVIGGIVAASFRVTRTKKLLTVGDYRVFQKSLFSSHSSEIKRELEMHAVSTNRRVRLSSKVRALL